MPAAATVFEIVTLVVCDQINAAAPDTQPKATITRTMSIPKRRTCIELSRCLGMSIIFRRFCRLSDVLKMSMLGCLQLTPARDQPRRWSQSQDRLFEKAPGQRSIGDD